MINKFLLAAFLLFSSAMAHSIPNFAIHTGLHIDRYGQLIQPDKFLLSIGLKQYNAGYNQLAFDYFKKSSALGNAMAQRLVGLMYVNGLGVEKDLIEGYAWLKVASHDKTKRNIELATQVYKLIKPQELTNAQKAYARINEDYGTIAALTRRDRWVHIQKLKMTGTHTGSLAFTPIIYDTPHGNGLYNELKAYVEEYNFGYVNTGEIIAKDENDTNN